MPQWISSKRLVDLIEELPVVRLSATDDVPLLSDGVVKRAAGDTTTRYFEQLAGPVFFYDSRWWNGAALELAQGGLIDLGDDFDAPITRETAEGVSRQYASLAETPVGYDWQALGGAPDAAALTFVVGFVQSLTRASSAGRSEATFEVGGDLGLRFSLLSVDSGTGGIEMEFTSGADVVSWTNTSNLYSSLAAGVAIMVLDLPDNTVTGAWVNNVAVPLTSAHQGDYADGPPYPDNSDELAVIDEFNMYLGRDQPSKNAGQFESAFVMALYRGAPSTLDRTLLQELYQPGFMEA